MIDFIYRKCSLPKINQSDLIIPGNYDIHLIKIFQGDKLLCLGNIIQIYQLMDFNFLCSISINKNYFLNKLEIIEKDKFIVFGEKCLILYKFIQDNDKSLYSIFEEAKLTNFSYNIRIHNVLYIKYKIICIGDHIFSIYNFINNKFELQTKIKSFILSHNSIKSQGFLLNKDIVGVFGYPQKQFEFWNIKTYKFIYITEEIQFEEIFIKDDNNIINLKDDDHVIIGNYMIVCKFSYKSRNIVKVYDFSINGYYQINNLLFFSRFHYISKFDLYKEKYTEIGKVDKYINYVVVLNEENFLCLSDKRICYLNYSKSKKNLIDLMKMISIIIVNMFYLIKYSKINISKISLLCSLALSPLYFWIYIREINYLYYISIILTIYLCICFLYDKFIKRK